MTASFTRCGQAISLQLVVTHHYLRLEGLRCVVSEIKLNHPFRATLHALQRVCFKIGKTSMSFGVSIESTISG